MSSKPFFLSEDYVAAIDAAADVLRMYVRKNWKKLHGVGPISTDALRPAIFRIANNFYMSDFYEDNHDNQIRARDAKKKIDPVLTALRGLRSRLESIGDSRWKDWAWAASIAYADLADVRDELSKRNAEIGESLTGTEEDFADHIISEIDIVWDDLSALSTVVDRVERRLQTVNVFLTGGSIAAPPSAFHNFIDDLALEWEKYIGQPPPAPKSHKDKLGNDKGGPFVDFVRAIVSACEVEVDTNGLGNDIANALSANNKARKKPLKLKTVP